MKHKKIEKLQLRSRWSETVYTTNKKVKQKNTTVVLKRIMMIKLMTITKVKNPTPMKNYHNWKKIQPVKEKRSASFQLWTELYQKRKALRFKDGYLMLTRKVILYSNSVNLLYSTISLDQYYIFCSIMKKLKISKKFQSWEFGKKNEPCNTSS